MNMVCKLIGVFSMLGCSGAQAQEKAYADLVYDLAQRAAIECLAKNRELLEASKIEWNKDSESYSFSAKRFGDFLTIYVSRGDQKYASALNIGHTREIKLVEGHGPDSNGTLRYRVFQESDDEKNRGGGYSYSPGDYFDGSKAPSKGYHYAIKALLPSIPSRQMVYVTPPPQPPQSSMSSNMGMVYYTSGNQYAYEDYGNFKGPVIDAITRPAQDDVIELVGIDTRIYIPAGKGAEVRDTILAEIASGYENKQVAR